MTWAGALAVLLTGAVLVPVTLRLLDLRPTSLPSPYAADVKRLAYGRFVLRADHVHDDAVGGGR